MNISTEDMKIVIENDEGGRTESESVEAHLMIAMLNKLGEVLEAVLTKEPESQAELVKEFLSSQPQAKSALQRRSGAEKETSPLFAPDVSPQAQRRSRVNHK